MTQRRQPPSIRGAVVLILIAVAAAIAPLPASTVERVYSRGVYPLIQRLLTPVSNISPIAWLDVAVGLLLLLLIVRFVAAGGRKPGLRVARKKWPVRVTVAECDLVDLVAAVLIALPPLHAQQPIHPGVLDERDPPGQLIQQDVDRPRLDPEQPVAVGIGAQRSGPHQELAAQSEARRKELEAGLAAKLAEAEKKIEATKANAMKNVSGIAADAAASIVERLTGSAPDKAAVERYRV